MFSRISISIFVAAAFFTANADAAGSKPTLESVGDGLICQCGCTQTVNTCDHYECATRAEMKALAEKEIAAGKDETTVLQDFVLRYGVQVLASPPEKGFSRTVWILPGLGLIVGLAVVIGIVRRWRKPGEASTPPAVGPVDEKILAAVEEEMKKVTG